MSAEQQLLDRVLAYAAAEGITGRSLREIAAGAGTSHRMLLYHFGSREGLMAAVVEAIERRQRESMASLSRSVTSPAELMLAQWRELSSPGLRPFIRLFFEVLGSAVQGAAGTEALLSGLTDPWIEEALRIADGLGYEMDGRVMRIGVAVARGLLLDLLAGADPDEVTASYEMFVRILEHWVSSADVA